MKPRHILFCFASAVLLSGCSTSKTESWANPAFKDRSIGKTIVLATFEDRILRGEFEALFADRLLAYVSAASMHEDVKETDTLDKTALANLLKENQVDTLVLTHLMDATDRSQLVADGVTGVAYAGGYSDYYAYCCTYAVDYAVDDFMEYVLETSLFDVKTEALIWTGRKKVYDFNSSAANMKKVINDVIWDLEKEGMLK